MKSDCTTFFSLVRDFFTSFLKNVFYPDAINIFSFIPSNTFDASSSIF